MSYRTREWAGTLPGFSEQQSDHPHNRVLQEGHNSPDHMLKGHMNVD